MAEKINSRFNYPVELVESTGGAFEITVGQDLIYSKKSTGLFPVDDFVLKEIESRQEQ